MRAMGESLTAGLRRAEALFAVGGSGQLWLVGMLSLMLAGVSAAENPLRLEGISEPLRSQHLFRVTVQADLSAADVTLAVALLQGDRQLARADVILDDGRRLAAGVRVVLGIPEAVAGDGPPVRVVATVQAAGMVTLQASREVRSLEHLRSRFVRLNQAFGEAPPALPQLWLEQAAEWVLAEPTLATCENLDAVCRSLESWQQGQRPPTMDPGVHLLAMTDPVDGSVQPLRLHRPLSPQPDRWILLLSDAATARKSVWTLPPTALMDPWLDAGWTIVEAYPAGDRDWKNGAARRALLSWQAAGPPTGTAPVLVGWGQSATAAVGLALQKPTAYRGVMVWNPLLGKELTETTGGRSRDLRYGPALPQGRLLPVSVLGPSDAAVSAWMAHLPGLAVASLPDSGWTPAQIPLIAATETPALASFRQRAPLPGIDPGPVTVVIGTGESQAAHRDNALLAESYLHAWAQIAQGVPTTSTDDVTLKSLRGQHLVLIGSPRSNRILAELIQQGLDPRATWDERQITCLGHTWLRAEKRPLLIRRPNPKDPRSVVVIVDGGADWTPDYLPGVNRSDAWVGALIPGAPPMLEQWFDSDWR